MSFFDWFSRKTPAEKIAIELEEQLQTKRALEELIYKIDVELGKLNPRIRAGERNVTSYTSGNLRALKAEKTTLEIKKMDAQRDIRRVEDKISQLLSEQRKLAA